MGTALFVILVLAIYFLPSFIGYSHRNANSIILLNLFLGWTLIGWVVALVWAVSNDKREVIIVDDKKNITEQLALLKELREDGTLTEEEFKIEKKRLLRS